MKVGTIKVEVQDSKTHSIKTKKYNIEDGILKIDESAVNILEINRDDEDLLSSICGIMAERTGSYLHNDSYTVFIGQSTFLRKWTNLYDDNGFLIINHLLYDYIGKKDDLVIPDGIEVLGTGCLMNSNIKTVSLPESLREIGHSAFQGCESLENVEFRGNSICEFIGSRAFMDCDNLKSVNCPESLRVIEGSAFEGCSNLAEIHIPDSIESVGTWAFALGIDAACIKIKNEIMCVGPVAIGQNGYRPDISIPEGITLICDGAFNRDDSLKSVVLSDTVRIIGEGAFDYCWMLEKFQFGGNELIIGEGAFKDDTALKEIEICDSVKRIGKEAFAECTGLNIIKIGDNVEYIGEDAFHLKNEKLPEIKISQKLIDANGGREAYYNYLGLPDDNGLFIRDGQLLEAYKRSSIITVPEGVKVIAQGSLDYYDPSLSQDFYHNEKGYDLTIEFPDTMKVLEPNSILSGNRVAFNLPEEYLKQKCGLYSTAVIKYLNTRKDNHLDKDVYISLYLYHQDASTDELETICLPFLLDDIEYTAQFFISSLAIKGNIQNYLHAAEFIIDHKKEISDLTKNQFYILCVEKKKKKAIELIQNMLPEALSKTDLESVETDPFETYYKDKYGYKETEDALKKVRIHTASAYAKCPVKYKDSGKQVPEFVVKRAILPYLEIDGSDPVIVKEAEEIADHFDETSYRQFIRQLTDTAFQKMNMGMRRPDIGDVDKIIHVAGRYGDESMISDIISIYEQRSRQSTAFLNGRDIKKIIQYCSLLRGAVLLNETNMAAEYCYRNGWLNRYAEIRGMSVNECISHYKISCDVSDEELLIEQGLNLYEKTIKQLEAVMNGEYSEPTVISNTITGSGVSPTGRKFLEQVVDGYRTKQRTGSDDGLYTPDELYSLYMSSSSFGNGNIGLNYIVGLIVAHYISDKHNMTGEVVFCRDKWEYREDYSSATRAALKVDTDADKWEVYNKTGYPQFEM